MQHKQKGFTMAISTTAAKFRKTGETLDYVAAANVMAGEIKVVCGLVCLALWDIAQGEKSTLKILRRGEVIDVAIDDALGDSKVDAGTAVYVVPASGLVTLSADDGEAESPTAYKLLGHTAADVATADRNFSVVCA